MNSQHELIIEAGRTERHYWTDIWRYRELFLFLAWRDILVRYKQTIIGAAWAVIRPVLTMGVFTIVFGKLAGLPSEGNAPYAIMVCAAVLPWQFFSNAFSEASNSLVSNSGMISKVYFPRLIVPGSAVVVSFVDFLISGLILVGMMFLYGYWPDWRIILLPLFTLLVFAASVGCGIWVAALNVKYRDFRYVIPFIIQFGLYISPVGFSSSIVPGKWRLLYSLNPMVCIIDGFRWSILRDSPAIYWEGLALSTFVVVAILFSGIAYFRKTEKTFADLI